MRKTAAFLLLVLFVAVAALPASAEAPADVDKGTVKLKVFVHYPRGQQPAKPDNPGKPPKPTPPPPECNIGSDNDDVGDFGLTGWKLSGTVEYRVNYGSIPATVPQPQPAIADSFKEWTAPGFSFVEGASTTLTRYKLDGVNLVAWGRVSASNAIAITYTWYYPSTGEVAEVDTIMNIKLPWLQNYVSNPDAVCGDPTAYDVQNILTHEVGHWVGLDDLYDAVDEDLTMYGYGDLGEVKKDTLGAGDIAGVNALY